MPIIKCNDIEIDYQVFGDLEDPILLGVQGLAEGWRFWPESFYQPIVDAGYCFVAIDNRDIGGSTIMDSAGPADIVSSIAILMEGKTPDAAYSVVTLAEDLVAFMDALSIENAHLVGYSMGGIVCQWTAVKFPERVASLLPLMTTSGNPELAPAGHEAMEMMMGLIAPLSSEDEAFTRARGMWTTIEGSGFPSSDAEADNFANLMVSSGFRPTPSAARCCLFMPPLHTSTRFPQSPAPQLLSRGPMTAFFQLLTGKISRTGSTVRNLFYWMGPVTTLRKA